MISVATLRNALLFSIFLMLSASSHAWPITVRDDRGLALTLQKPPTRIVSLLPSITESLCALGQCGRMIAVDRYSNFPASVRSLPQVGGGMDPNIEAIVALRPDLVLAAGSSLSGSRLLALGIPVFALEPKSHDDVQRTLEKLEQLLQVDNPGVLWHMMDRGVTRAAQTIPVAARNMRVYIEVNLGPYGASESSFMGQTLARLGLKNVLPANLGPFPKINPEFVVRANPDLIMITHSEANDLARRPGWSSIRAVREHRICMFSQDQSDILVRPGPRMALGAQLMAQCVAHASSSEPNAATPATAP
jgi:iron complex transport system substrate-binding protein